MNGGSEAGARACPLHSPCSGSLRLRVEIRAGGPNTVGDGDRSLCGPRLSSCRQMDSVSHTPLGPCCRTAGVAEDGQTLVLPALVLPSAFENLFPAGFEMIRW